MRKFILLLLSVLCISAGLNAQNLSNGYYRVTNAVSDRYIHVLDNKGSLNMQTSSADMGAITLKKGIDKAVSDPASVLYVEAHGSQFDIRAQSTGIYAMIGLYVNIIKSPSVPDAYWAYGKKGSVIMYLWDAEANLKVEDSYLDTKGFNRDWYIKPIDNSTDNYFGVQPTHQANGKYYASFYAAFPFSMASSGMKAYYIYKVDESKGVAVYKEITGTVPALTPVIIECSSNNPADNKLNIGGNGSAPSDNVGKGVLFEMHKYHHDNYVTYNKSSMRTIGVAADGSLAMTAADYKDVPKNTFYIPVSASCPATLRLVHESQYDAGPVEATSITLNPSSLALNVGASATLTANIAPANTTDKTVTWTSSNPAVASVDANGSVKAVSVGSATITATCGKVSATCAVTVSAIEATGITLSQSNVSLTVGGWTQISATVAPDNATNKTVTWTSSNPAVATVDKWGTIRAIASGNATITASCGKVSASCAVTVSGIDATAISLSRTSLDLQVGATASLSATVLPDNASNKTVTWSSSNPAVATVDANGTVKAVSVGNTTITASCGNVSATCAVTVSKVEATGITLSQTAVSLTVGGWTQISATVAPDNAYDKTVTWSSSNPAVATVDKWGTIRAIAVGNATITATCGKVSATCAVSVSNIEASGITLSQTAVSLTVGGWTQISAIVTPDNAYDKTVTWSSSDPSVATVDKWGTIRAIAVGNATITATCGKVSATCAVTVSDIEATGITLSQTNVTLNIGGWTQISATVIPENTKDKTVTWTSSDQSVATVDKWGTIRAIAAGNATITASCGKVSATCSVTVTQIEASTVTLSSTVVNLTPGESFTLYAEVQPDNTTDKTITWESSNTSVATVDANGTVTAVAPGSAVISAICGKARGVCSVTVSSISVTSIQLSASSLKINIGEQALIEATVMPENATDKTVKWISSDSTIASVDADGMITGVAEGVAVIKASCGSRSAFCTVIVTPAATENITLSDTAIEITVPDTYQLTATVNTDKPLTWTSSNTAVATVDATGLVTAIHEGNAIITVTCGEAKAECAVKVNPFDSIYDIISDGEPFDVYNLQGIKVRSQVTSLDGLAHGFYIVNGHTIRH